MFHLSLTDDYDFTGAPCVGNWLLFDSTDADDVWRAKQLCATCPHRAACRLLAADQPNRSLTGVWGGIAYKDGRPLTEGNAA